MSQELDVSILIPVYNEEQAIKGIIDQVSSVMQKEKYSYEVLIVDDASDDKTREEVAKTNARLVKRSSRGGAGAARKTGIRAALGKIVVMLDGDGSYEINDIPKMLAFFPEYDQVNGARTSEQGTLKYLRAPAKWFIRKLACYLTDTNIPDLNTGLKAFKKDIMLRYLWVVPNGFSCVTTMTLAFLCNGHSVKYIPTSYYPRIGQSKFHPVKDTYQYFLTVVRMVTYFNPLKIFLPMSFGLFLIGIAKSLYDFFFVIGRLQQSDIIILLASVMIFSLGLLADLIVAQSRQHSG
ncbi:MAG TPA: glycosyltransferase family 2 protein [Candidatus Omnitrophota bacterium]|nr:glycosyltransferase family 2 protein [Candidatus Omnitrophota bacterium]